MRFLKKIFTTRESEDSCYAQIDAKTRVKCNTGGCGSRAAQEHNFAL